jgi:exodeoxyribonuclease V gamma subunit
MRGAGNPALPPTPLAGPLTLRMLAEFLKNPARSFLRHRLGIVLPEHDEAGDDDEPFALDGLDRWGLHDGLIALQQAALQGGGPPAQRAQVAAQAVGEAIAGHARAGRLPLGGFGAVAVRELAATQDDLRQRLQQALERWPQALPDEEIDHRASPWPDEELDRPADPPPGSVVDESLRTVDLLQGLRADASGARARVLPLASRVLDKGRARVPKLTAPWVEHLAGHLAGRPLSTVVVGVDGDVTLPPLEPAQARALWAALVAAWHTGRGRPLPLAPEAACAWLAAQAKGGDGAEARAFADARKAYEHHDPRHQQFAEVRGDPCLARAFPGFDALWSDGEFAHWVQALLQPLWAAVAMQGGEESAR